MKYAIACSKNWFIKSQKNNIKKFIKITKKNQLSFEKLKKKRLNIFFSLIGVIKYQKKFMKILIVWFSIQVIYPNIEGGAQYRI